LIDKQSVVQLIAIFSVYEMVLLIYLDTWLCL